MAFLSIDDIIHEKDLWYGRKYLPETYQSLRQSLYGSAYSDYPKQKAYLSDTIRSARYAHSSTIRYEKLPILSSILMAIGSIVMIITGFIFLKPVNAYLIAVMGTLVFIVVGLVLTVKMLDRYSY